MGFQYKKDYEAVTGLSGYSIYADSVFNLCIWDKLFLQSTLVAESGGADSTNVLTAIPMFTTSFGACAVIKNEFWKSNIKKINKSQTLVRFWLTDEFNNIVDLNGVSFSFT